MPQPTLEDVRQALKDVIVSAFPNVQCTGYVLTSPTPPFFEFDMGPEGVEYHKAANNGAETWQIIIRGVVAATSEVGAHMVIGKWYGSGTGTVKAALENDKTLGGTVDTLKVVRTERPRTFSAGAGDPSIWLGAEWTVELLAGA